MKAKLLPLVFTLFLVPVVAQTAPEIDRAYGKPTLAYSVTEHIWMTPDLAADGQVCRMRFYPKTFYRDTVYSDGHLNFAELKWILNHLVPPSERGSRKFSYGLSMLMAGVASTSYEYEKVTFTFAFALRIRLDLKALKALKDSPPVGLDFPIDSSYEPPKPPPPSESDFDNEREAEIAILQWNDRSCAEESNSLSENDQKIAQIEQRFGQPQKIYTVASGISMTPGFARDGQVCQMWLYPTRISGEAAHVGNTMLFEFLRNYLNTFVPPADRGLKQEVNFGTTATGGRSAWTTYPYENVSFTFWAVTHEVETNEPEPVLRKGEFTFGAPDAPVIRDRIPSENDFHRSDDSGVVVIRWPHRACI